MPKTKTIKAIVDVNVQNHGSLYLFHLNTAAATEWVDDNVHGEQSWFAGALAVERRYAVDLAEGMLSDGLVVQ